MVAGVERCKIVGCEYYKSCVWCYGSRALSAICLPSMMLGNKNITIASHLRKRHTAFIFSWGNIVASHRWGNIVAAQP